MKNAIGHRKGTPTYAKHYRSKRSSVDLQGLLTDGNEDGQRINPSPKSYIPAVQVVAPRIWTSFITMQIWYNSNQIISR